MNKGCNFQGSKHVFHSSVREKPHTLVAFLFEWNFTHLLTAIQLKPASQISLKWVVLQIKAEAFNTTHIKRTFESWKKVQLPMHSCEQVVFSERYICCNSIPSSVSTEHRLYGNNAQGQLMQAYVFLKRDF